MDFTSRLAQACQKGPGTRVCVGLDIDPAKMPPAFSKTPEGMRDFALAIVGATHKFAAVLKTNLAFSEAEGAEGVLAELVQEFRRKYPDLVIIGDGKPGDIGNTAKKYAKKLFQRYQFHACTFNGYLGPSSLEPFLKYGPDYGVFALARTSNKDAAAMQDGMYTPPDGGEPMPYYLWMARQMIAQQTDASATVGLVMGATSPEQIKGLQGIVPVRHPLVIPGIGIQGGDLAATVKNAKPWSFVVNSSREILYGSSGEDFAEVAARTAEILRDQINEQLALAA